MPHVVEELCDWPGCINPALCSSGNAGGALVCSEHFSITNGKDAHEITPEEEAAIKQAYRNYLAAESIL